jgi:acetylglutamate kinase
LKHTAFLFKVNMNQSALDLADALQAQGVIALDAIEAFAETLGEQASIYLLALVTLARK